MRTPLLPIVGLVALLTLTGCTDTGDPTVTPPTASPADDRPYVNTNFHIPRRPGNDLVLILTSAGPSSGSAGYILQRGSESVDLDLQIGEPVTELGHTFELLRVTGDDAALAITDPSGNQLGYDPRTDG